ncbi:MAG TPA: LamG-like jellyroll fold domain-containing protein, partial [Polyangiaceae bacterium]
DDEWSIAEYATFSDGGKVDRHVPLTLDPPTGRWTHVLFVGDGSSITVSFDGNPDGTLTGLASFAAATGVKRTVDVGFPYIENTKQPLRVRFDDIAFTP